MAEMTIPRRGEVHVVLPRSKVSEIFRKKLSEEFCIMTEAIGDQGEVVAKVAHLIITDDD